LTTGKHKFKAAAWHTKYEGTAMLITIKDLLYRSLLTGKEPARLQSEEASKTTR
jgi:hypothetical protein